MYIIGRISSCATDRDRALLNLVQSENAHLRRIQDRRAHERAEHAAVGDGERSARQILEGQRSVLRPLRKVPDGQLDLRE